MSWTVGRLFLWTMADISLLRGRVVSEKKLDAGAGRKAGIQRWRRRDIAGPGGRPGERAGRRFRSARLGGRPLAALPHPPFEDLVRGGGAVVVGAEDLVQRHGPVAVVHL